MKALVGNEEEMDKVWNMLNTCYNRPEKYIAETLEPIIKFRKYKVFKYTLRILLPSQVSDDEGKGINLLSKLINEQTLLGIMAVCLHKAGSSGPTRGHPVSTRTRLLDQKWRDPLNVAA